MADTERRIPGKVMVIDALMAGHTTTAAIAAATGLPSNYCTVVLYQLRREGAVTVQAYGAITGKRGKPGHIYRVKGAAHG